MNQNSTAEPPPAIVSYLSCAKHGVRKWQGHVMCNACGRVYQTKDPHKPHVATQMCKCGVQLMPKLEPGSTSDDALGAVISNKGVVLASDGSASVASFDAVDWKARRICYACFRVFVKRHGGRIPNFVSPEAAAS